MSNDAVEYVYLNVGYEDTASLDAAEYAYLNVGSFGITTTIGKVVGIAFIGRHGVAHAYLNVLDIISGDLREMEDGAARHLEDGTTERTLE